MKAVIALLCTFVASETFEGQIVGLRQLQRHVEAGVPAVELETVLRSGYRFYRVVEEDDTPYEVGETIRLREGPCDNKVG